MKKFSVQEYQNGAIAGAFKSLRAQGALEAAQALVPGCVLRRNGTIDELRVRARVTGFLGAEFLFYSDLPHGRS